MANAKHLPWIVIEVTSSDGSRDGFGVNDSRGMPVLVPLNVPREHMQLFAAAPDLLAAVRAILLQANQGKVFERAACITQARQAYLKATGSTS